MKYITCLVKYDNIYTVHGFQINIELKKNIYTNIFVYRRLLKINHSGKKVYIFLFVCLFFLNLVFGYNHCQRKKRCSLVIFGLSCCTWIDIFFDTKFKKKEI